jgi:predicted hydrocarbon binding protein
MGIRRRVNDVVNTLAMSYSVRKNIKSHANQEKSVDQLAELNDEQLVLLDRLSGIPSTADMWGTILSGLIDAYGPSVVRPMRKEYSKVGAEHGQLSNLVFTGSEKPYLAYLWVEMGYLNFDKVEIVNDGDRREIDFLDIYEEFSEDDDSIVMYVDNTIESLGIERAGMDLDYGVCIFAPAYGRGLFETWFDREINLEEVTCQGNGDDHCTWVYTFDDAEKPEISPPEQANEIDMRDVEDVDKDFRRLAREYAEGELDDSDLYNFQEEGMYFMERRSVPLGAAGLAAMTIGLVREIGPSAVRPMRDSYSDLGSKYAKLFEDELEKKDQGLLLEIMDTYGFYNTLSVKIENQAGSREVELGNIVDEYVPTDEEIIIEIKDSATYRGMRELGESMEYPSCVFEPAFIQGAFSEWFDKDFKLEEPQCQNTGESSCVWRFEPK